MTKSGNTPRRHHRRRDIPYFLLKSQTRTLQNKKLTMYVWVSKCNGNLPQKALWKLLAGARIDPNCALVADVKTKFFCPWWCRQGCFGGHFLACWCSQQHHRITHFLLISPVFRGVEEKGEEISCLVVKSGKCYQRVGEWRICIFRLFVISLIYIEIYMELLRKWLKGKIFFVIT